MITETISEIAVTAKAASLKLAHLSVEVKNRALEEMASALEVGCSSILDANVRDLEAAERENISAPLFSRLRLDENKVMGMAKGIRSVVGLDDPVGRELMGMELDEGLISAPNNLSYRGDRRYF